MSKFPDDIYQYYYSNLQSTFDECILILFSVHVFITKIVCHLNSFKEQKNLSI